MLSRWSLCRALQLGRVNPFVNSQQRFKYSHAGIAIGEDLGPTRKDDHRTVRVRKIEGDKELPLPPALDPIVLESKEKWKRPKAQPKAADFTPFQRKLQANPYAHALASPVRQCRATLVSLPAAFLTSLHTRLHPTTEEPWLLPVSLTTDEIERNLGQPYRFVGRRHITAYLGKKRQWQKGLSPRIVAKLGPSKISKLVWREDLADIITDLMRKQLVNTLGWSFGFRGRLTPVASPRSEDIEGVDDVSCVLLFRSLCTRADDILDDAKRIDQEMDKWSSYVATSYEDKLDPHRSPDVTHNAPSWYIEPLVPRLQPRFRYPELDFRTTIWRGQKVPVYSVTDLLGEESARQFIEGSKYAEHKCVVMKRGRHNVPVEILLMRLQAYMTTCGT